MLIAIYFRGMSLNVFYLSAYKKDKSMVFLKCFGHQLEAIHDLLYDNDYRIAPLTEEHFNNQDKAVHSTYIPGAVAITFEYKDSISLLIEKLKIS